MSTPHQSQPGAAGAGDLPEYGQNYDPAYGGAGYGAGGYEGQGYEGQAYPEQGYEAYGDQGYGAPGHEAQGYETQGYEGQPYEGPAYDDQGHADQGVAAEGEAAAPAAAEEAEAASGVNWPTVLASVGAAAIIAALIVTIGVVGLLLHERNSSNTSSAQQPTVVNLGAATQAGAPAPAATNAPAAGAAQAPAPAAPTEQVEQSGAGTGTAPAATATQAPAPATQAPATQQQQQAATPAPLSAGQLTTKVKLIMNPNASRAARISELEGGAKAMGSVDQVSTMLTTLAGPTFSYQVIGPVTQNGTRLNATLQMALAGSGTRTLPLSWVWMDNKWKLTNESVCTVAQYAMIPCSV